MITKNPAWGLTLLALGCATPMPLTERAQTLRVVQLSKQTTTDYYGVRERCKKIGANQSDDKNQLLNEAGSDGANTVLLEKGHAFRPDWNAEFYSCPTTP